MPLSSEEDEFLEVASSSLFRVIEMIAAFPVEHRAGAFEVAEHRYMQAARDFGCAEEAATRDDEAFENGVLRGGRSGKRFAVALAQSLDPDRGSQPNASNALASSASGCKPRSPCLRPD